jgi:hypothetical protein
VSEPLDPKGVDPFEELRRLNPVQPDTVHNAASSDEAQRALEDIVSGRRRSGWRTRLRRPRLYRFNRRPYILILIPIAGAIAAGAWALTHGASKHLTIGCYGAANLQAHTVVVANEGSPVVACRIIWRRGDFGARVVPQLEACVLPSGAIGVFPGPPTTCRRLKLEPLAPVRVQPRSSAGAAVRLKKVLVNDFLAHRCENRASALATVKSTIRSVGAGAWTVQVNGSFSSKRPCASLAFDEPHERVLLVPTPRQP